MKKCDILKGKMFLFLVAAILVLCVGFFIVGCGVGPATKAANSDIGNFAIDFNATASVVALNVSHASFPSLLGADGTGKNITVEAWIKPETSTAVPGGILGRYDSRGVLMWVTSNVPKFAIRVKTSPASTSTDYTVTSGTAMTNGTWYHVAGVLTNTAHTHTATTSCTVAAMAEQPHLDIYVDGTFKDCATTWGDAADPTPTAAQGILNPDKYAIADNTVNNAELGYFNDLQTPLVESLTTGNFVGVIDEVRLWTSARTATQIANCMNAELSISSSECNVDDPSLIGYWRFNTGSGSGVSDSSGNGLSGTMEVSAAHWSDGWVTGKFE